MEAFVKESLVPDMLDNTPAELLEVIYDNIQITPGNIITPTQVKEKPTIKWDAQDGAYYTLIFDDPDAPSRTDRQFGEFNHWLVTNIPGNDIRKGQEMSEYVGSGPGKGSGLHRYVFLLYKQPGILQFKDLEIIDKTSRIPRRCWKAREFASKYNLEGPIAGNFFQAEWDEWVPHVHRQLGIV